VTKGALISLTKSLSSELGARGFASIACAGMVTTEMSRRAGHPELDEDRFRHPVGRAATTMEIADRYCFCARRWRIHLREVLNVNGGAVLVADEIGIKEITKMRRVSR